MAEGGGGPDEDSGDVAMLAGATTAASLTTTVTGNNLPTQHQPLNLKAAEDTDHETSSIGSPEPASTMGMDCTTNTTPNNNTNGLFSQNHQQLLMMSAAAALQNRAANLRAESPMSAETVDQSKMVAAAAAHLNGTMANMVTLQNLQNLASLQQTLPQVSASLAANLQNLPTGLTTSTNSPPINAPLNLSVTASAIPTTSTNTSPNDILSPTSLKPSTSSLLGSPQQTAATAPTMPQFILASGQLVHGIQGAQLLIPTSQGIATQTILTIPVNHVNSNDQMVNLALNNGQVMTTSLANLQAMAAPQSLLTSVANTGPTTTNPINSGLLNHAGSLPQLINNNNSTATAQKLLNALQQQQQQQSQSQTTRLIQTPPPSQSLLTTVVPSSQHTPPLLHHSNHSDSGDDSCSSPVPQNLSQRSSTATSNQNNNNTSNHTSSMYHQHSENSRQNGGSGSPNSSSITAAINSINRLTANNSELTITTTHGPTSSNQSHGGPGSMKLSPTSMKMSPCTDTSTADLLIDSPNQPTINQTSSNVVDGINLDEIKEFAKAFKLRRLSLGLTQTQVGQALSITEGPAYSQSAICSALATQMYCAAQLSSQQQAMFEKLDITPKSAQKIKPVLERWMKEAEERYKSGQNHLTDFIGVEPSKKRKRRTSFTPQALELLNAHFERNTHPSGTEITGLAHQLGYEREVIRIWFCNKRQALKNTVRMMSKGMV